VDVDLDDLIARENPDAVIAKTRTGTVVGWNDGAVRMFGYARAEAIGRRIDELIIPSDKIQEEEQSLQKAFGLGSLTYEAIRRKKDGGLVYVEVSNRSVSDANGNVELVVDSEKDVTDLKVLREAKLVEANFRDPLEAVPDGIVIVNAIGRIILANSQVERVFGYQPGTLLGASIEVLLPKGLRSAHVGHRSGYFANPKPRSMGAGLELYGLRFDGSEFPVEISLNPIQTDEGLFVMSAVRDITDRKRAEQKFKGLLESAPDAIVIVNRAGDIVLVNSQTERLFGYRREELLGKKVEVLIPERYGETHPAFRTQFFDAPIPRAMGAGLNLQGLRRDGSQFPVEISLSPLETEEGVLVSGAIRDITERRTIERVLNDKNVELQKAADAKNRFLATMSHELRTPLNAVLGFTGTLLMKLPGPLTPAQEKQLRTIQSSGRHLLSLINDLLDLAKIESGKVELKLEPVECGRVIEEVAASLKPMAEAKGLRLLVDIPDPRITIRTDQRALSQIVINLTTNAIKYTDQGEIAIGLESRRQKRTVSTIIRIRDTGRGVSSEDQAKLFHAFSQIDTGGRGRPEGTGLGLHLSRKLADLLGGRIEFETAVGKGSTFFLIVDENV
jgi:PAS domain S-box-containing protein